MKTQSLLKLAGVSALVALTLSLSAGEILLSPRAAATQIKVVKGTDSSPNTLAQSSAITASPRAIQSQTKTVAGVSQDADTMICSRKMVASPKATSECASHPGAAMSCCGVATGK